MKVTVDKVTCIGCGLCTGICPDVFEMKGDFAIAKQDAVTTSNEADCRQAASDCPVSAIIIE